MNLFVIGDVHGCYHTFMKLLQQWKPDEEILIQVGDLVDRGNYVPGTVAAAIALDLQHPGKAFFLKGNHEYGMIRHYGPQGPYAGWLQWGGKSTIQQYQVYSQLLLPHLIWLAQRPLVWENEHILISHAGVADTTNPYDLEHPDGILWRRGPLKAVGKLQVVGHTPTNGMPYEDHERNAIYIDTGAYLGRYLTGVKLSAQGEILEYLAVETHAADIA
ncbi:metallophosphoesterase family protein [Hymenobacter jejuensis]|uniref:Serine/threonine protein phosphatase n=1 Tax=Hymenobacter jejuensis TaxID=2502781 RepID=A0A5B8A433_9BACT|nr:metallophosphoesterase family protein [Hymenobacter jejuensis]QDA61343.1 serine/threonine protein phosphatase [Hymenobacter jejuensis]